MKGAHSTGQDTLENAVIELTDPNGKVYRFRYVDTVSYAAEEYVVLAEMAGEGDGNEMVLITTVRAGEDGLLAFEVVEEEDIIESVLEKYTARMIRNTLEESDLTDSQ